MSIRSNCLKELTDFYASYSAAPDKAVFLNNTAQPPISFLDRCFCRETPQKKFNRLYRELRPYMQEGGRVVNHQIITAFRAIRLFAALFSSESLPQIDATLDRLLPSRQLVPLKERAALEKLAASRGVYRLVHKTFISNIAGILASGALRKKVARSCIGGTRDDQWMYFTMLRTKPESIKNTKRNFQFYVLPGTGRVLNTAILVFSASLFPKSTHFSQDMEHGKRSIESSFTWADREINVNTFFIRNEAVFKEEEIPIFPFLEEIWVANEDDKNKLLASLSAILHPANRDWENLIRVRDDFPSKIRQVD